MEKLREPILHSILEAVGAADGSSDIKELRHKIIDVFDRAILSDGIVFFLPDQHEALGDILLKNHDKKYIAPYKRYYYRFDPIHLSRMENSASNVDLLEDVVNYEHFQGTEYYTDFLEPQKIHYKLIANLEIDGSVQGRLALTRSKRSIPFDTDDVRTAKLISPYLAHCLLHYRLRRRVELLGSIVDYLEGETSVGVILLDKRLRVLHLNKKAGELLGDLNSSDSGGLNKETINSQLLKDCRAMSSQIGQGPLGDIVRPKKRILTGRHQKRFCICSKIFNSHKDGDGSPLFMIRIKELLDPSHPKWTDLAVAFHLSPREIDVVPHLFSGLKNAEIAEKLFISEITVKKHLQSIYAKIGVKNRTSLINKILTLNPATCLADV